MIVLTRTDSTNQDFIDLVKQLDAYLAVLDGDEHSFYKQYKGKENSYAGIRGTGKLGKRIGLRNVQS